MGQVTSALPIALGLPCVRHCALGCVLAFGLQELAALGQQLLTEGGGALGAVGLGAATSGSNNSIPTDVLVAAARQHLMAAEASQLQLSHVALLLADYQQLAASYYAHMMLSRCEQPACGQGVTCMNECGARVGNHDVNC